jgi:hypothetical protein
MLVPLRAMSMRQWLAERQRKTKKLDGPLGELGEQSVKRMTTTKSRKMRKERKRMTDENVVEEQRMMLMKHADKKKRRLVESQGESRRLQKRRIVPPLRIEQKGIESAVLRGTLRRAQRMSKARPQGNEELKDGRRPWISKRLMMIVESDAGTGRLTPHHLIVGDQHRLQLSTATLILAMAVDLAKPNLRPTGPTRECIKSRRIKRKGSQGGRIAELIRGSKIIRMHHPRRKMKMKKLPLQWMTWLLMNLEDSENLAAHLDTMKILGRNKKNVAKDMNRVELRENRCEAPKEVKEATEGQVAVTQALLTRSSRDRLALSEEEGGGRS